MPRDRPERRAFSPVPHVPASPEARITLGIMLATLAAKLALAWHYDGFLTGDDFEIVASGAKYALGLPYRPWSLRCEFHPLVLVAPILALLRLSPSPPDPSTVAWLSALPTALASTASIGLLFRLAPSFGLTRRAAVLAAAFFALHGLPLGYGATQYPRPISTMLFLGALLLVSDAARFRPFLGGLLLGAAFAVRFSEGALLAPFLVMALRTRPRQPAAALALGVSGFLIGALLCVGGSDAVTWGQPFRSVAEFVRIMHGGAPPSFPHYDKPWYWYATSILQWAGPAAVLLAAFAAPARESRLPLLLVAIIVVGYSAFAYKTYRYLQAAIPLVAILMALGAERAAASSRRWRRGAACVLMAAAPLWGVERAVSLLRDKSMDAVAAGRWIRERRPRAVLLEQAWAYGGVLVVGEGTAIADVEPRPPLSLREADLADASVAAFYPEDLSEADRELLRREGFEPVARFARFRKPVEVFERRA